MVEGPELLKPVQPVVLLELPQHDGLKVAVEVGLELGLQAVGVEAEEALQAVHVVGCGVLVGVPGWGGMMVAMMGVGVGESEPG